MVAAVWPGATWEREAPTALGVDAELLSVATANAARHETAGVRDMTSYLAGILRAQPAPEVIGPLRDGAGASGVVVHRGKLVAEWGPTDAVEMSFSVTKSYLSLLAGVAFDRGLFRDARDPIWAAVKDPAFDTPRHRQITWTHLLHQTSEWAGSLWGKAWWVDPQGGQTREERLGEPGTVWAYNDVRINLLALALTRLWRRPLDDVLRTEVMAPIGASPTWQWHGYDNACVDIDGRRIGVVSGGAHWGGGFWSNAYDHARIGHLYLHRGQWQDRKVLSDTWVDATTTPSPLNPDYGMLWWLNRRGVVFGAAPPTGFCARGNAGRQLIWVDPARDLVVVSRWTDADEALLGMVSRAIADP